jgi:hypothetical protein
VRHWSLEAQCVIVRGQAMAGFLHNYECTRAEHIGGDKAASLLPPPRAA